MKKKHILFLLKSTGTELRCPNRLIKIFLLNGVHFTDAVVAQLGWYRGGCGEKFADLDFLRPSAVKSMKELFSPL